MYIKSGTRINGRYRILEQVGVGGTAVVYKAMDEKLNRVVTLKALREEFVDNEEFLKRFTTEAQAAARLNHPNIVSAYDVGRDGEICYIIMEYIDGYTLKELILKNAPFTNEETLGVSLQIASALEAAHKNGIIHRDIKPQNILVTKDGDIKVTDFGIAKAASSSTITTEQMGSAHYFSPEQAKGGFVDHKSDIYSLGIVMYEMLTGRPPFDGESTVALAIKHMDQPLPDIKDFNSEASESLIRIIAKATAKRPSMRYSTAEELSEDLKHALTDSSGSFVRNNRVDRSSHTIVMTSEERRAIRERAGQNGGEHRQEHHNNQNSHNNHNNHNKKRPSPATAEKRRRQMEEEETKSRNIVISAIITGVAIVAVLTVIVAFLTGGNSRNDVIMPRFIDMTQEMAEKTAKENGIYLEIESVESDKLLGTVVGQSVEEGKKISRGDTVTLEVSVGNGEVEFPDVVGYSMEDAQRELKNRGITNVTFSLQKSTTIPSGTVISTDPVEGEMIRVDKEVTLFISISDSEKMIEVENVLGKSRQEAVSILEKQGFSVKVEEAASDAYPEGQICAQSKDGGFEALEGSTIMIYVSTGPDETATEAPTEAESEPEADTQAAVQNVDYDQVVMPTYNITIPVTQVPDKDKVTVTIAEVGLDGSEKQVYSKEIQKSSFPYSYSVTGSGSTYKVYYDGVISAVHSYDDGGLSGSSYYVDGKLSDTKHY